MTSLPPWYHIPIKDKGVELSVASAIYGTPVMGKYGKIKKLQIVFTIRCEAYMYPYLLNC